MGLNFSIHPGLHVDKNKFKSGKLSLYIIYQNYFSLCSSMWSSSEFISFTYAPVVIIIFFVHFYLSKLAVNIVLSMLNKTVLAYRRYITVYFILEKFFHIFNMDVKEEEITHEATKLFCSQTDWYKKRPLVMIQPYKQVYLKGYMEFHERLQSFECFDDDVWITSHPKCGMFISFFIVCTGVRPPIKNTASMFLPFNQASLFTDPLKIRDYFQTLLNFR